MIHLNLNDNLIDDFNLNGFLILDKFIDVKYINELKNKFEPLFKGEFETGIEPDEWNWRCGKDPEDVSRQICNAWKSDNLIKKFLEMIPSSEVVSIKEIKEEEIKEKDKGKNDKLISNNETS